MATATVSHRLRPRPALTVLLALVALLLQFWPSDASGCSRLA